jgi:hypothetical protein
MKPTEQITYSFFVVCLAVNLPSLCHLPSKDVLDAFTGLQDLAISRP